MGGWAVLFECKNVRGFSVISDGISENGKLCNSIVSIKNIRNFKSM